MNSSFIKKDKDKRKKSLEEARRSLLGRSNFLVGLENPKK